MILLYKIIKLKLIKSMILAWYIITKLKPKILENLILIKWKANLI